MKRIGGATARNSVNFVSHGFAVRVVVNQSDVLERVLAALPFGARITEVDEPRTTYTVESLRDDLHTLRVDGEQIAGPATLQDVLDTFASHAMIRIAERAPDHVFVHSGVVVWHGRAILFPGYSFFGKTTLVADCVRAGAIYFSDEYAVLDGSGRVYPYPRPLQIREHGDSRQTARSVSEIGGAAGTQPLPVALVIFSRYVPEAIWRPRTVTPGRAALEMLQYTMSARYRPERALDALQGVFASASTVKSKRGETAHIIDYLTRIYPT